MLRLFMVPLLVQHYSKTNQLKTTKSQARPLSPGFCHFYCMNKTMETVNKNQLGITLIELVITIVVVSILAGIASTKINLPSITVNQQAEQFAADIRHAQSLAINWGCELTLTVTATQYQLTSKQSYAGKPCNVAAAVIKDPATTADFTHILGNDVQFSATGTLYFDGFGRPINAAGTIINTDTVFDLTANGLTYRVTVIQLTGYVSVVKV